MNSKIKKELITVAVVSTIIILTAIFIYGLYQIIINFISSDLQERIAEVPWLIMGVLMGFCLILDRLHPRISIMFLFAAGIMVILSGVMFGSYTMYILPEYELTNIIISFLFLCPGLFICKMAVDDGKQKRR